MLHILNDKELNDKKIAHFKRMIKHLNIYIYKDGMGSSII